MSKILFIVKSRQSSSSRIRIMDMVPTLTEAGFDVQIEEMPKRYLQRRKLFKLTADFDITVLQRQLLSWIEIIELRKHARILGFDFDDAIYHRPASPSENPRDYLSRKRYYRFQRIARNADFLLPANNVLAGKAQHVAPSTPTYITPSPIIIDGIEPKTGYTLQSPPVIGWIGSKSTLRYIDYIAPALKAVHEKHPFTLHVIADEAYHHEGLDTRFTPWTLETQYKEVRAFDVGIMPLSNDPFSEGKAAFKLLQYMACAVPAVCSAVGMNADVSQGNTACLMANEPGEFTPCLLDLLEHEEKRRELGTRGRQQILERYSLQVVATSMAQTFQKMLAKDL